MTTQEIINRMAGDIGYIRAVAEKLEDADLPNRVGKIESTVYGDDDSTGLTHRVRLVETKTEKVIAKAMVFVATSATVATAVFAFLH